jgi:hypothetical protein
MGHSVFAAVARAIVAAAGGAEATTGRIWPQAGHFTRFPANSSLSERRLRQDVQAMVIVIGASSSVPQISPKDMDTVRIPMNHSCGVFPPLRGCPESLSAG